ncbi:MAG: 4Fe-4S binding protein [Candidatus Latescibacterota bacterium]
MSVRKIVMIDEEKCDGCGLCVPSCAEGAIQIIDGKAKLVSEMFCDGLGACLGECPQDAITIEERDADGFDAKAVEKHLAQMKSAAKTPASLHEPVVKAAAHSCPGSAMRQFMPNTAGMKTSSQPAEPSLLGHWPVQLMLIPPHAPFLKNSDMLICADCVPFTVPDFHQRYLSGRAVLVGCPKLDDLNHYYEKLKAIFAEATPRKITVLRMEVPCCGGISQVAAQARNEVAPGTAMEVHTIGIQGNIQCDNVASGKAA